VNHGCALTYNWWVIHNKDSVELHFDDCSVTLPFEVYKNEVLSYIDSVSLFYKKSKPKQPTGDSYVDEAWSLFWKEWFFRRNQY